MSLFLILVTLISSGVACAATHSSTEISLNTRYFAEKLFIENQKKDAPKNCEMLTAGIAGSIYAVTYLTLSGQKAVAVKMGEIDSLDYAPITAAREEIIKSRNGTLLEFRILVQLEYRSKLRLLEYVFRKDEELATLADGRIEDIGRVDLHPVKLRLLCHNK